MHVLFTLYEGLRTRLAVKFWVWEAVSDPVTVIVLQPVVGATLVAAGLGLGSGRGLARAGM